MNQQAGGPPSPEAARAGPAAPPEITPLEVTVSASEPHPSAPVAPQPQEDAAEAGEAVLQEVLPELTALARKVGGFKRLAELAAQLDRAGAGQ